MRAVGQETLSVALIMVPEGVPIGDVLDLVLELGAWYKGKKKGWGRIGIEDRFQAMLLITELCCTLLGFLCYLISMKSQMMHIFF